MYRNDCVVLLKTSSLIIILKKEYFLTNFHFYIKCSIGISGKALLHFYQEIIPDRQPNYLTNPNLDMSRTMSASVLWSMLLKTNLPFMPKTCKLKF